MKCILFRFREIFVKSLVKSFVKSFVQISRHPGGTICKGWPTVREFSSFLADLFILWRGEQTGMKADRAEGVAARTGGVIISELVSRTSDYELIQLCKGIFLKYTKKNRSGRPASWGGGVPPSHSTLIYPPVVHFGVWSYSKTHVGRGGVFAVD